MASEKKGPMLQELKADSYGSEATERPEEPKPWEKS